LPLRFLYIIARVYFGIDENFVGIKDFFVVFFEKSEIIKAGSREKY